MAHGKGQLNDPANGSAIYSGEFHRGWFNGWGTGRVFEEIAGGKTPRRALGFAGSAEQLAFQLFETTRGREEAVPAGATHDDSGGLRTDFDNVGIRHVTQPRWHSAQITECLPKCSARTQARLHRNVIDACPGNQRPTRPFQYG